MNKFNEYDADLKTLVFLVGLLLVQISCNEDGATSVSPNQSKIAFESYGGDPDDSDGTGIWILEKEITKT